MCHIAQARFLSTQSAVPESSLVNVNPRIIIHVEDMVLQDR